MGVRNFRTERPGAEHDGRPASALVDGVSVCESNQDVLVKLRIELVPITAPGGDFAREVVSTWRPPPRGRDRTDARCKRSASMDVDYGVVAAGRVESQSVGPLEVVADDRRVDAEGADRVDERVRRLRRDA